MSYLLMLPFRFSFSRFAVTSVIHNLFSIDDVDVLKCGVRVGSAEYFFKKSDPSAVVTSGSSYFGVRFFLIICG